MNLNLSGRTEQLRTGPVHSVYQQVRVFAYEVLGFHNE
jgi:hypothetical protein